MKKIGVIAGAFDPIHNGHINFIDSSLEKYGLDRVLILIEEQSKFKQSFADFAHRQKIVELSVEDNPKIELYRSLTASFPLSSTLPELKSKLKSKFYLLVGNDVKEHILNWPGSGELLKDIELVIADRTEDDDYKQISSGKVRGQIKNKSRTIDMQKDALDYCFKNNLYD